MIEPPPKPVNSYATDAARFISYRQLWLVFNFVFFTVLTVKLNSHDALRLAKLKEIYPALLFYSVTANLSFLVCVLLEFSFACLGYCKLWLRVALFGLLTISVCVAVWEFMGLLFLKPLVIFSF